MEPEKLTVGHALDSISPERSDGNGYGRRGESRAGAARGDQSRNKRLSRFRDADINFVEILSVITRRAIPFLTVLSLSFSLRFITSCPSLSIAVPQRDLSRFSILNAENGKLPHAPSSTPRTFAGQEGSSLVSAYVERRCQ